MPSKSQAQHNFMEMMAHNPEKAKGKHVPKKVAKEFVKADKKDKSYKGHKKMKTVLTDSWY